jgi:peptidoglycan hydrolase CwlO-like protein
MKRYLVLGVALAALLAGPTGCNRKEMDELKNRVTQLESDLKFAQTNLAERDKELIDFKAKATQAQGELESQTAKLTRVTRERDSYKKELTACRKRLKP